MTLHDIYQGLRDIDHEAQALLSDAGFTSADDIGDHVCLMKELKSSARNQKGRRWKNDNESGDNDLRSRFPCKTWSEGLPLSYQRMVKAKEDQLKYDQFMHGSNSDIKILT